MPTATDAIGEQLIASGTPALERADDRDRRLVADGLHARTDGFTSLAVLIGAAGAALGWRLADPIV